MDKKKLGMEMGAEGYLVKPVKNEDLIKIFNTIQTAAEAIHEKILLVGNRKNEMEAVVRLLKEREKEGVFSSVENLSECMRNMQIEKFDRILLNSSMVAEPENKDMVIAIENETKKSGTGLFLFDEKGISSYGFSLPVSDQESSPLADNFQGGASGNKEAAPSLSRPVIHEPMPADFLKGKKVLLVDDDMRNIYALTSILEGEGVDITCAYNGHEALEKLKENPFIQLVLMDIMMPGMNGYEATHEIRQNPKWSDLPVIALTANAMNGDREKCIRAGASDYLSKPVNIEQLLSVMKVWLYQE